MNKIKDIYFFFVVLYSGMSIAFFTSKEGLILLWTIGFIIFNIETLKISKSLLKALSVWMGFFLINTFLIRSFHSFFMFTYIAKIMIAYWLLTYYGKSIFLKYENVIYALTLISIFFYLIQITIPDQLYSIFRMIDLSDNLYPNRTYASIGIYTYHLSGIYESFPRNAGFTWEPGPFSCYIALAIFFNLTRSNMILSEKRRLIVLLTGLVSTQSTTGFVALLVIILWFVWERYRNKAIVVFAIPVSIIIIIFMFINIPWMQEKIISESGQQIEDIMSDATKYKITQAPGRFASFQLRWEDFKKYPIAGFGGNGKLQTGYIYDEVVIPAISGVGTILGKYGSIGAFLFLWLLMSSGTFISKTYQIKSGVVFPVLILVIGFSFNIIESPLIFTLILSSFFCMSIPKLLIH